MDKINPRWEFSMKTTRDIYEKTLRQCMSSLSNKEIKESLKKNKEKLTMRFNTCLVLLNDIEHIVRNATNSWKNIYLLHKLSDFVVSVSDKEEDDDEQKEDKEDDVEEVTHFDNVDDEEEQGWEANKVDAQDIEETNLVKIGAVVIASLPHCPRKIVKTSIKKKVFCRIDFVKHS